MLQSVTNSMPQDSRNFFILFCQCKPSNLGARADQTVRNRRQAAKHSLHIRRSFLYTALRPDLAHEQREPLEVLGAERAGPGSTHDEWNRRINIGPTRRNAPQPPVLVVEDDSRLTPGHASGDQLELLPE